MVHGPQGWVEHTSGSSWSRGELGGQVVHILGSACQAFMGRRSGVLWSGGRSVG